MSIETQANGTSYINRETSLNGAPGAGGAWTVACWLQYTNNDDVNQHITIGTGPADSFDYLGGVDQVNGSNVLRFYVLKTSTAQTFSFNTGTLSANTWYHVACVFTGTRLHGYLNGALVSDIAAAITSPQAVTQCELGYADGRYSDACYFAAALNADEVAGLYAARLPKRRANLFVHWPCFFSARTQDFSGTGNTATETGTTTDPAISPPAGWGTGKPRVLLPAAGTTVQLIGTGVTIAAGAATDTKAVACTAAGATRTAAATTGTKAVAAAGAGATRTAAASTGAKTLSITPTFRARTAGAATETRTSSASGTGTTRTAGLATLTGGGAGGAGVDKGARGQRRFAALVGSRRRVR